MGVYPGTQGPVDTFRPQYKVGEKKVFSIGVGKTEKEAIGNALYKMCDTLNCDFVASSRCMFTKTEDQQKGTTYEAKLIGFPVYITGLETVKSKFYDQQKDGTLKPTEAEHRTIFSTNLVWKTCPLPGKRGKEVNSMCRS